MAHHSKMEPAPVVDTALSATQDIPPQEVKLDEQQCPPEPTTQDKPITLEEADPPLIDLEDKPQVSETNQADPKSDLEVLPQPIANMIEEPLISNPIEAISEPVTENPQELPQAVYPNDNGIFDFMTPDRAIELFKRIHSEGIPGLDWKFYGRRRPGDQEREDNKEVNGDNDEFKIRENSQEETMNNTEFDFDVDEFSDLQSDTTLINESLSLKKRPEPAKEKKTNLSDIMSDIMKESHIDDDEDEEL